MNELVNYGALGLILLAFLGGVVFAKPTVDRIIVERDKAEAHRDQVLSDVFEKVAPVLERTLEAVKSRESYEADISQALSEVRDVLVDVRRMLEQRL